MGDLVTVQSSDITSYTVEAVLYLAGTGPGADITLATAKDACTTYVSRPRRQGVSVWRSAITAALHVVGVDHLELIEPSENILLDLTQAGTCLSINLSINLSIGTNDDG